MKSVDKSSESACLSLAFHELQHIPDPHWSLDVSDEVALVCLFSGNEDDLDLGDTTARTGPSE